MVHRARPFGNVNDVAALARVLLDDGTNTAGVFLPARVPLAWVAGPVARYFEACADLPNHYPAERGGVRRWLDRELGHDDRAVRRAIAQLGPAERDAVLVAFCVLGHTYRWDTVPPASARFEERRIALPPGLAGPWTQLARAAGQPRVGTVWTLHLNNWRMVDRPGGATYRSDQLTGDNLRVVHNWLLPPVDGDLERFSLAFVQLEAHGGHVVRCLVEAIEGAAAADPGATLAALERARRAIAAMTLAFSRNVSRRRVDPETWLRLVQPTFVWSAEAGRTGRIEGGPSGMQLGTIQALDAVLGVSGSSSVARLSRAARRSMPPAHRRFLRVVDLGGRFLRDFVTTSGAPALARQFDACLQAVISFRATHRSRGARYLRDRARVDGVRASTGLVIDLESDPVAAFERSMTARIRETHLAMIEPDAQRRPDGAPLSRGRT